MSKTKISVLIPTRGRPKRLDRCIMHLVNQAESPENLQIVLGVDNDDAATAKYIKEQLNEQLTAAGVSFVALSFNRLGYHRLHDYLNSMAPHASGDWLIFFNDDAVMQTQNWDQKIRKYDGKFLCLAFDTHNHHPYSIWPVVPKEWIQHLGVVSNHHMFDAVISQMAYLLGIMERTDIKADHERFDLVGGEADETAQQRTIFEGNTRDPRDINHVDNIQWRMNMAEKLSELMAQRGVSTEFWHKVKQGKQNPWEQLKANDPNNQMQTFARQLTVDHIVKKLRAYQGPRYSQLGQDSLALAIFGTDTPGYFVEFGGLDGVENSNSLLLEKNHNWQGLLAEPARIFHDQLRQNRRCRIDHRAVTSETGKTLEFKETDVELGLSGLTDYFHPGDRHTSSRQTSAGNVYLVSTVSLNDLLDQHQCPDHIQYLSIDTEGSELEILRNFDFGRRRIDLITVEHNYVAENREAIRILLEQHGYCRILTEISQWDDWYLRMDVLKELQ